MKEKGKNMKTIYKKPTIQCIVLGSHPIMLDNSEIEITDDPVDPGRRGANEHRGDFWSGIWSDEE